MKIPIYIKPSSSRGWAEAKAENLELIAYKERPNMAELRFDFACPNCGRRHHRREITRRYFDHVGYSLKCGNVEVSLGAWAS